VSPNKEVRRKVTETLSGLAAQSQQSASEFVELTTESICRATVRGLAGVDYELQFAANKALRNLASVYFRPSDRFEFELLSPRRPDLIWDGLFLTGDQLDSLPDFVREEKATVVELTKHRDDLSAGADILREELSVLPSDSGVFQDLQRAQDLEQRISEITKFIEDDVTQIDKSEDAVWLADAVINEGRWPTIRGHAKGLTLRIVGVDVVENTPVQLVDKSGHLCQLADLYRAARNTTPPTKASRVLIFAPERAWDPLKREPLPMPDEDYASWVAQQEKSASGSSDRDVSLDAWRRLVDSWNSVFSSRSIRLNPRHRRARSSERRPSSDSGSGKSPTVEQVSALQNDLVLARAEIRALQETIRSLKDEPCGLCDHCWVNKVTSKPKKGIETKTAATLVAAPLPMVLDDGFVLALPKRSKKSPPRELREEPQQEVPPSTTPLPLLEVDLSTAKPASETSVRVLPSPSGDRKNQARLLLGIPLPAPFPEGITLDDKNRLIAASKIPKWVDRGLQLDDRRFLKDLREKRVNKDNFNEWSKLAHEPTRADLIKEWTDIRRSFAGTDLIKRPKSEQEHKFVSAYQRLKAKCDKFKEQGVVPSELPDPPQQRAKSPRPQGRPQPVQTRAYAPVRPAVVAPMAAPLPLPVPQVAPPPMTAADLARALQAVLSQYIQ